MASMCAVGSGEAFSLVSLELVPTWSVPTLRHRLQQNGPVILAGLSFLDASASHVRLYHETCQPSVPILVCKLQCCRPKARDTGLKAAWSLETLAPLNFHLVQFSPVHMKGQFWFNDENKCMIGGFQTSTLNRAYASTEHHWKLVCIDSTHLGCIKKSCQPWM